MTIQSVLLARFKGKRAKSFGHRGLLGGTWPVSQRVTLERRRKVRQSGVDLCQISGSSRAGSIFRWRQGNGVICFQSVNIGDVFENLANLTVRQTAGEISEAPSCHVTVPFSGLVALTRSEPL